LARSFDVVVNGLDERPVEQARVLLVAAVAEGETAFVLDAGGDEFVRIRGLPPGPDTRLLALAPDGRSVLAPLGHYDRVFIPPSSNGAWLNNHELVYADDSQLSVADVDSGEHRVLNPARSTIRAVSGNQIIRDIPPTDAATTTQVVTCDLDGGNVQPYITVQPRIHLTAIDIARLPNLDRRT
jgi:hypothetical protein